MLPFRHYNISSLVNTTTDQCFASTQRGMIACQANKTMATTPPSSHVAKSLGYRGTEGTGASEFWTDNTYLSLPMVITASSWSTTTAPLTVPELADRMCLSSGAFLGRAAMSAFRLEEFVYKRGTKRITRDLVSYPDPLPPAILLGQIKWRAEVGLGTRLPVTSPVQVYFQFQFKSANVNWKPHSS